TDERGQEMDGMANAVYAAVIQAFSFASPEILSLPEDKLQALYESEELAPYRFNMQKLLDEKPHVLSEKEEGVLAAFSEVFSSPGKIAGNLQDADMLFEDAADSEGVLHPITQANYIMLQMSGDRTLRKNAFTNYYRAYKNHINTFASTYQASVKKAAASARVRHYEDSRAMYLAGEHIPAEVYDSLVKAVREAMPQMYRYVALRKKLLGLSELHYYDLYTPLAGENSKTYSYDEAKEMVLSAVKPLGSEYVKRVEAAYAEGWIDVYPNKGKRSGAFSSGTYDSKPYILLNYTGSLDSVSTLAHEMGHSQHTWLANAAQEPQNADYTLFVAEVASTVNENLLIEQMLDETHEPAERLALLNHYLEGFKGTVFRQTMFAEFERDAHSAACAGKSITPAFLGELYLNLVKDYFGDDLTADEEVALEWARIPHFYRPFYVYKYATSYCAAVAISEAILKDGEPAAKKYLDFLSMGGSAYPIDELKTAGVDFTSTEAFTRALDKFGKILDEAERVAAELLK
nr:oligoendopeptidase F [Lachnospiraceae bacterium]